MFAGLRLFSTEGMTRVTQETNEALSRPRYANNYFSSGSVKHCGEVSPSKDFGYRIVPLGGMSHWMFVELAGGRDEEPRDRERPWLPEL